jgi:hypothetical protein
MMAVVALAFSACKKQETNTDSMVFNHSMEQFVMVNDENEFEKVYLDNSNNIAYEKNDRLMLFDIRNDATKSEAVLYELAMNTSNQYYLTPVSGSFTNTSNAGLGDYYAFYPGDNVDVTNIHNENRVTFTLDTEQTYRPNTSDGTMIPHDALYIAAKAEQHELANAIFGCRNICGILALNFWSPSGKKVSSIQVTDNAFNIVGDVELKVDEVDPDYMSSLFSRYSEDATYQSELADYLNTLGYNATGTKTVTLNCGSEGVALGQTKAAATRFYIVMRPLALLKGCEIKINFVGGGSKTIKSTKNNVIKPNTIRNMTATNVG